MDFLESTGISRRTLLAGVPAAMLLPLVKSACGMASNERPKIAAIVTEYRKYSHGQGIVDRFLDGYGWESRHHHPALDIVGLYVDQVGENDLSRERTARHRGLTIYPTIAETLALGGDKLAVDGVLLIGEHGKYPRNERGQTLYPRYEFFQQIVSVFRASGRSVPVFNDKHLSWNWDWALEMVETARSLGFPFMAGSSVPVAWRLPSVDLPWQAELEEVVCVGVGGIDSYDFHSLEAVQCLVERRRGGETGVVAVQALQGDQVWDRLKSGSWQQGGWDGELFEACLCRSHMLTPTRESFNHVHPTIDEMPGLVNKPIAYRYEYADGLKATILLLEGLVGDLTVAARFKDDREPLSLKFYLGAGHEMQPNFFNPLVHHIESLFLTGESPYPVERTLLTTGLTAAGVESLWRDGARLETPHLAIRYQPAETSTFRRT